MDIVVFGQVAVAATSSSGVLLLASATGQEGLSLIEQVLERLVNVTALLRGETECLPVAKALDAGELVEQDEVIVQ